jgi:hypothetical protein
MTRRPPALPQVAARILSLGLSLWLPGCAGGPKEGELSEPMHTVSLSIVSPAPGDTLPGPDVEVRFELSGYEVYFDSSKGMGQHIHFILDNEPYIPHYATTPFVFRGVPQGTHTIRAFPSREWHESIKDSSAFAMVTFHVGQPDGQNTPEPGAPLLTYSRPKGEYAGHMAGRILVDYWLSNCELGTEQYRVRLRIDGTAREFLRWEPYWVEGLTPGEHTISLVLVAPDGNPVPGPFNATNRTFSVAP